MKSPASERRFRNSRGLRSLGIVVGAVAMLSYPVTRIVSGSTAAAAQAQAPPATEADRLLQRSLDHATAGRFEDCVELAERSATLDPKSSRALNNVGYCSGKLGRWDVAVKNLEAAIKLEPASEVAKGNLAWVRQEQAKVAKAPR